MDNKTNKHEFACNAGKVTEYEVKEHIDTIMVGFRGFSKEVSIVKWNDKNPVFDIRAWRVSDRDGLQYPLRGITFSKEEFIKLREILNSMLISSLRERFVLAAKSLYSSCKALSMRIVMVTDLSSLGVTINFSIMQFLH